MFFHHEYPWIISASDDQTVRIWNWQSRNCISVLTGHNHYVMCAQFHPKEDLVVSASLDQTVRVWDISGLRKKSSAPTRTFPTHEELNRQMQVDAFAANSDVLVKFVLEGHERGVNWASFHPTLPLIVSGADDRQIKLWRMSDTKAWEVDTCRGHFNNVSCVMFHPRQELIISDSEDKSIRVWDMTKRTAIQSFRRESDRFWVLAAHPDLNLFAAGHDTGLIVFKLERERPASIVHGNSMYYVKDKFLRNYNFDTNVDVPVCGIRKSTGGLNQQHRSLSYNPAEHAIIATSNVEGGLYEIYSLPKQFGSPDSMGTDVPDLGNECRKGQGQTAIFVARNRYAVLNRGSQQLYVKNLNNDSSKAIKLPEMIHDMFYAGTGNVLLAGSNSVSLYDLQKQTQLAELQTMSLRYVFWNASMSLVALVGKHTIVIANKKLEQQCLIHETIRIKGGCWDDKGVFIYSTLNHIKYALPQGDKGIIRTLDHPLYICKSKGNTLFGLDRDAKIRIVTIDPTEYRFKLALINHRYDEVMHIIRNSNLVGQSIIAYLRSKGYSEVALQFVKEPQTRFDLALECGNLEVATEVAKQMDIEKNWISLANAALKQGNQQIVELAYQRIKNFERLSFLYLITGNQEKLSKMTKIAEMRGDVMSRFHNSLYLGDVEEQIKVFMETGQFALGYVLAKRHGLTESAQNMLELSGRSDEDCGDAKKVMKHSLLAPPIPLTKKCDLNWPLLPISKATFDSNLANNYVEPPQDTPDQYGQSEINGWSADMSAERDSDKPTSIAQVMETTEIIDSAAGWGIDDEELELQVEEETEEVEESEELFGESGEFQMPTSGPSASEIWIRNSPLAVDHVAAGQFESAMQLLTRQVGIVNFAPLKQWFLSVYSGSHAYLPSSVGTNPIHTALHRNWQVTDQRKLLPSVSVTFQQLLSLLQKAYQGFTGGQFGDSKDIFSKILHCALLTPVSNSAELNELKQMIKVSREYLVAIRLELSRREIKLDSPKNQKRALEIAAYLTHCDLQPAHTILCLQVAMVTAYKVKCLQTASLFARRMLDLGAPAAQAEKARKMLSLAEKTPHDELSDLAYDPLNPFVICAKSLSPIYKGEQSITSTYCNASYKPEFKGEVCVIDSMSRVGGEEGTGFRGMI